MARFYWKAAEVAACLGILAVACWPRIVADDFWRVVDWLGL